MVNMPLNKKIETEISTKTECDTKSIFQWSIADLNSEFPSLRRLAILRLKKPVCPTIYPKNRQMNAFFKCISANVMQKAWFRI